MVYRSLPDADPAVRRRVVLRVVLVWLLAGATALAAAGLASHVRASARVPLSDERVWVGPLSARLPKGWNVVREAEGGAYTLIAEQPDSRIPVRLIVSFEPAPRYLTATNWLTDRLDGEPIEPPRPVEIAGRKGDLLTLVILRRPMAIGAIRQVFMLPARVTAAGVLVDYGDVPFGLRVVVDRFGELDGGDALVVTEVARSVRVEGLTQW